MLNGKGEGERRFFFNLVVPGVCSFFRPGRRKDATVQRIFIDLSLLSLSLQDGEGKGEVMLDRREKAKSRHHFYNLFEGGGERWLCEKPLLMRSKKGGKPPFSCRRL